MHDHAPLPRWFLAVFTVVMLFVVAELFLLIPQQAELRFQIDDLALSLETSRQREAKQLYEYDQVAEALPLTRAELDAALPLTQQAAEQEQALRTRRKELRAQQSELNAQLEAATASATDLQAQLATLLHEVDALRLKQDELQQQRDALQLEADALQQP